MLEGVLASEDGVWDGVGIDHPRGAGGELEGIFGAVGLEARILFEEIVEAHHEVVVGRALEGGDGGAESDSAGRGFAEA